MVQSGYCLVGADGGVFSFGDAQFYGSLAGPLAVEAMLSEQPTAPKILKRQFDLVRDALRL